MAVTGGQWRVIPRGRKLAGGRGEGFDVMGACGGAIENQEIVCDKATYDDALLIAEAGSVYNETGLTPSQLVEQRAALLKEMERYLRILERAENDVPTWSSLAYGTGIATLNSYRAAIAQAKGDVA